jgi:hypothetical protein
MLSGFDALAALSVALKNGTIVYILHKYVIIITVIFYSQHKKPTACAAGKGHHFSMIYANFLRNLNYTKKGVTNAVTPVLSSTFSLLYFPFLP